MNSKVLSGIYGITVHFSADCNMNCSYCFIAQKTKHLTLFNKEICKALESGEFAQTIIDTFQSRQNDITDLGLWGAEPTINGKYFKDMLYTLLDFFPNMHRINFSTNGKVGADWIIKYFCDPIATYAESHQRNLYQSLQLSIDGPPELNDSTRDQGITNFIIKTAHELINLIPSSKYYSFSLNFKPTISLEQMTILLDNNDVQYLYDFYDTLGTSILLEIEKLQNQSICNYVGGLGPTLVYPMLASVKDGKMFQKWLQNIRLLNKTYFYYYKYYPVLTYGLNQLKFMLYDDESFSLSNYYNMANCSAGKNNFIIDYTGNLSCCHSVMPWVIEQDWNRFNLQSNSTYNKNDNQILKAYYGAESISSNPWTRFMFFQILVNQLCKSHQIDEKYANDDNMKLLWWVMNTMWCHLDDEDITGSQYIGCTGAIRLWGNGALDELIKIYRLEEEQKNGR